MGRSVKSAKSSIKDTYQLMDSLQETVRNDIKSNISSFEESLRTRLSEAENAIIESSRAREAMVAGIIIMRKSIEKAQRKFSRNNNVEDLRNTLLDVAKDISRLRLANDKISDSISMVIHPNMSAVEAVEKFAFDIQRFAGSWERIGREIDQSIGELCDDQEPSELIDLESFISKQGYDKLIQNQDSSKSSGAESE
ncbi:MAG: hypothetical protein P8Q95_08235 [Candidatus Poseidoniaceae archaeon]|nr:hypothetical protein [Candidatus Poseidoniaceae archaeon]